MTTIAAPSVNQCQSTLAASYTRGTDTTITLVDGTLFPSPTPLGHVIYIYNADETKWCLVIYTSKATHVLTMGGGATDYALAKNVSVGDEAYEFPIGCVVELVCAVDEIALLFSDKVSKTLFDANTILAANTDDTPAAVTVAEQRLVGRITAGNIDDLTPAQVMALLSGQAGAAFDFADQNLTNVGTVALDGGQIAFPATAVPSADANTLDDYEEGSWTPDLQFGGAKVGITYSQQAGFYTKVGNAVTISSVLQLTSKGSSNGNAEVKDLPFTLADAWGSSVPLMIWPDKISFADYPIGFSNKNTTTVIMHEITNAGVRTNITDADWANDSELVLSGVYMTD